jgi:hypothetical protein
VVEQDEPQPIQVRAPPKLQDVQSTAAAGVVVRVLALALLPIGAVILSTAAVGVVVVNEPMRLIQTAMAVFQKWGVALVALAGLIRLLELLVPRQVVAAAALE